MLLHLHWQSCSCRTMPSRRQQACHRSSVRTLPRPGHGIPACMRVLRTPEKRRLLSCNGCPAALGELDSVHSCSGSIVAALRGNVLA